MMNGKKTTKSNDGLDVIDVVCINTIMLKVFGVEPVSRWPWLIVLSPWLIYKKYDEKGHSIYGVT